MWQYTIAHSIVQRMLPHIRNKIIVSKCCRKRLEISRAGCSKTMYASAFINRPPNPPRNWRLNSIANHSLIASSNDIFGNTFIVDI